MQPAGRQATERRSAPRHVRNGNANFATFLSYGVIVRSTKERAPPYHSNLRGVYDLAAKRRSGSKNPEDPRRRASALCRFAADAAKCVRLLIPSRCRLNATLSL